MNKNNFKNTCVFAACGVICITLLGVSALSFAKTIYASDTGILNIELDDSLYNGLLSLSESSDGNDRPDMKNLYVIINGREYPVVGNGDGKLVVQNVGTDDIDMPLADITGSSRYTIDADGNRVYHIVWGDTLSELALEFGSSVNELAVYNQISNPDLIYAEDDLYLPEGSD